MKFALLAAAAAFSIAGSASSATVDSVSFSASTAPTLTDFTSVAPTPLTLLPPFELGLFDGALGTLVSVELTLAAVFEATGTLENLGTDRTLTLTQEVLFTATPDLGPDLSLTVSGSVSETLSANEKADILIDADGEVTTVLTGADVAPFVGAAGEVFEIDFDTLSSTIVSGGGNLMAMINTNASLSATVEYTFLTQVPLPATAPLLLAALGGLGFASRRRKAA